MRATVDGEVSIGVAEHRMAGQSEMEHTGVSSCGDRTHGDEGQLPTIAMAKTAKRRLGTDVAVEGLRGI